jgi:hypothetical protein
MMYQILCGHVNYALGKTRMQVKKTKRHFILDACLYYKIPLPSDDFLFDLLEPWDIRALSIRKTADLPLQLWVGTFPRFVAIGFYFLSETLI